MIKLKKWLVVLMVMGTIVSLVSGCSSKAEESQAKAAEDQSLVDQTLFIYCGAGMTKPFGEITDQFKAETGCDIQVVYANALSVDECDAIIIWKENVPANAEIINTPDLNGYVKTVPAAKLSSSSNTEALAAFMTYLGSDPVKTIWEKNGYEVLN